MPMSTPTGVTTLPLASCSAMTRSMRGNIGSELKLSTDTFFIIGCLFGSNTIPVRLRHVRCGRAAKEPASRCNLPDPFTTCPWRLERCAQEQLQVRLRVSGPSRSRFVMLPFGLHFVLRFAIARGTMAEQKFQDV